MIGQTISHYKILDKLGEGGMGVVYKAQDTKLDRLVALKFLPQSLAADAVERERFIHEAKAASALNHPNVSTIHNIEEDPEGTFIVMEYVEGLTLRQLIAKEALSVNKILEIAIAACEGITAAHKQEMVHRDIKSDNIMVSKEGLVKIMDFGLAKLRGGARLTQAGSTVGTVEYLSPEQAQGAEVDQRSDIFSFGVVLYELLSGQLPFKGEHPAAVIYSILNEQPLPLIRFNPQVSPELEKIVFKALAKDKEERYQHVGDLAADLKRIRREMSAGIKDVHKSTKKSVGVLYFENLSSDPESDYFAAGMTEDIITDLSKIEGIRVASRNAVLPYKGKPLDIQQLGRKMNLDAILEGSIRKAGNRLRITAQLVDVKEGFQFWAERYDRELKEVFDLQEDIAKNIASALKVKLSEKEEEKLAKKYKGNLLAYDYYLRGRSHYYQYTKPDLIFAIQMFRKALEIGPDYALAYAGLADSYFQLIEKSYETDKSFLKRAEEAAQKALSTDPQCAEAYKALGTIYYKLGKFNSAKKLLSQALEIAPDYVPARANLGEAYRSLGEYEQAEKQHLLAHEQEPTFAYCPFLLGALYAAWNKLTQAEKYVRKALELGESSYFLAQGNGLLGWIRLNQNEPEQALEYLEKSLEIEPDNPEAIISLAATYAALGEKGKATQKIEKILQTPSANEWIHMSLIEAFALLKDRDRVYEWLEKGIINNQLDLLILEYSPLLGELRKETKFQQLVQEYKNKVRNSE